MLYSHKKITRFGLEGEIYDDSAIPRLRSQYTQMIISRMRHDGYVPRYDIDTEFSLGYNGKTFDFKISIYGVYVGKKRAKCIQGIDKNEIITSTTTQSLKSEEVS